MQASGQDKLKKSAKRLGLRAEQMPRHIAIIMDGNGRWAHKKALPRVRGHRQGAKIVEKIALHCVNLGIDYLTLYSFSMENWKRPKDEINSLMYLYSRYLVEIRPTLHENNVKLVHLGRMAQLPSEVKAELKKTIEITGGNTGMVLALALNYGSRTEIVDATRRIARKCSSGKMAAKDIDENCISRHLYTAALPEPDLLIRTANERRISNFLLWQISYSEFYVTKTLWPDFGKADLEKAIRDYARRGRRFGDIEPKDKE